MLQRPHLGPLARWSPGQITPVAPSPPPYLSVGSLAFNHTVKPLL